MAQMTVRNIDEETFRRLKERAARNKRSLEAEVRVVLDDAVRASDATALRDEAIRWARDFRAKQQPYPGDTTAEIRADRDSR